MWQTGLSSRVVNETKKKIDTNKLGPKNVQPNLIDNVEGKGQGGWAKGLVNETQDRGKPLQPKKKAMRERMNGLGAKATRLTDHFTAMHFTIQSLDRISGATKWCFAYIRPEQPAVITVTEYLTTSYR